MYLLQGKSYYKHKHFLAEQKNWKKTGNQLKYMK